MAMYKLLHQQLGGFALVFVWFLAFFGGGGKHTTVVDSFASISFASVLVLLPTIRGALGGWRGMANLRHERGAGGNRTAGTCCATIIDKSLSVEVGLGAMSLLEGFVLPLRLKVEGVNKPRRDEFIPLP